MKNRNKFSIEYCKKILNRDENNFTDEQVKKIRDFLFHLAEIEYEHFQKSIKTSEQGEHIL